MTDRSGPTPTRVSLSSVVGATVLLVLALGLAWGAVALARSESAPAGQLPGTLVSVDHRDGGDSGTGLVTVTFTNEAGKPVTSQVVLNLTELPSLEPGTPVTVYVRDGQAVNEPAHFGPSLATKAIQALIIWIALAFTVMAIVRRVERQPRRSSDLTRHPPN